jgi:hypoxanthine-guanine phosphoribosyltransferase
MADAKVTKLFDEREIAVRVEEIASKAVDRLPRDCLIVGLLVGSFVHAALYIR